MVPEVETRFSGRPGVTFLVRFGDKELPRMSLHEAVSLYRTLDVVIKQHATARWNKEEIKIGRGLNLS